MRRTWVTVLCTSLLVLAAAPAAAQTGEDLFQQALVKERAGGDVRGAIQIYERIAREFARDRALAAKALVQLGRCHEKLGNQEAQRAYRRVVQEYADQTAMAREARARLTALEAALAAAGGRTIAEGAVTLREIRFDAPGKQTPFAMLSPDGTKAVYLRLGQTPTQYSIRVRTLASDEDLVLIDSSAAVGPFEWSPDGSQIAFGYPGGELRTIEATGGSPRVVWSSPDATPTVVPLDWAPDGKQILVAVRNMAKWTTQVVLVPTSGAAVQIFKSGSLHDVLDYGQFSPDGAYIAGIKGGDVYVWSVDGDHETRITTDPAEEEGPFWSPDGKFLVFCSDRSGDKDVWAVPMQGSWPSGPPVRVKAGLGGRALVAGMTASGALVFITYGDGAPDDLFVMDVDAVAGASTGDLRPVARYATQHSQPRWSPDGTRLAYTSRKGRIGMPRVFVEEPGSGQRGIGPLAADYYVANVEWDRDGKSLLFPGFGRPDGRAGIFRLSLENATVEPVHLREAPAPGFRGAFVNLVWLPVAGRYFVQEVLDARQARRGFHFHLMEADGSGLRRVADSVPTNYWAWPSPDGRHVAYRDERSLRVLSLEDQQSQLLSEWPDTLWFDVAPGWSPDGRQVAWTERTALEVLDTRDGKARTLVVAPAGLQIAAPPTWAPDGSRVAYVVRDTTTGAAARPDEVWLVPASGGSPRKIALAPDTHPRLRLEAWLPNGTLAAGGTQLSGSSREYRHWVLEGYLPKGEATRR